MLLVFASRHDEAARALVRRWSGANAALFTAADLSTPGWRYDVGDPRGSTAGIGGSETRAANITGVLVRLPAISEEELSHIDPAERSYVAQEMTAFLMAWLSTLPCRVLNRPDPPTLTSPVWSPEKWVLVAHQERVAVTPVRTSVPVLAPGPSNFPLPQKETETSSAVVTVVGGRCLGNVDRSLLAGAVRLARRTGSDLLSLRFNGREAGSQLVAADPWANIADPLVADALLELFETGCRRRSSR